MKTFIVIALAKVVEYLLLTYAVVAALYLRAKWTTIPPFEGLTLMATVGLALSLWAIAVWALYNKGVKDAEREFAPWV